MDLIKLAFFSSDYANAAQRQYPNHIVLTRMGTVVVARGANTKLVSLIIGRGEDAAILAIPENSVDSVISKIQAKGIDVVMTDSTGKMIEYPALSGA